MLDDVFIIDEVAHSYNLRESNFLNERHAKAIRDDLVEFAQVGPFHLPEEVWTRNWDVEETANLLFLESDVNMAVFQPLPITCYKDGLSSVEKAAETQERWPDRFLTMATIDPMKEGALEELERQVELLDPVGVKLYPYSWGEDWHEPWFMDDQDLAFPVFEKARELDLNHVSIHKSIPLGPVGTNSFEMDDVDAAATNFPELDFVIVHGGFAFVEEMAWKVASLPNVYTNLETTNMIADLAPETFAERLAEMFRIGGKQIQDKIFWGTGVMSYHPQRSIEAFWDIEFSEDLKAKGLLGEVPPLTEEVKRKILGKNYADFIGLDIDAAMEKITNDEFNRRREANPDPDEYSTTKVPEIVN